MGRLQELGGCLTIIPCICHCSIGTMSTALALNDVTIIGQPASYCKPSSLSIVNQ